MFARGDLLNFRLCFYTVAFIHLAVAAVVILSIDMSNDPDPRVSAYITVRWRLLTCWFNLITLAYLPICLYCDWKEKIGQKENERVVTLRKLRDLVMTSILFPTIMYADLFFWRLWYSDKALLGPPRIFEYLPNWSHHSLHTVSMVFVVCDLLLVPRTRPDSLVPGLAIMTAFNLVYSFVLIWSYANGIPVYSFFDTFSVNKLLLVFLYTYIEMLFYYTTQWYIIDVVWGRTNTSRLLYKTSVNNYKT